MDAFIIDWEKQRETEYRDERPSLELPLYEPRNEERQPPPKEPPRVIVIDLLD